MSTTVIINPKTGLGEAINPYPPITGQEHISEYELFFQENPPLPVITSAGETLTEGTYECEKVWQYNDKEIGWTFMAIPPDNRYYLKNLRQVWKVIETPVTKFPETVKEVEEYEAIYGPPPELPDDMKEPTFLAVEEAAFAWSKKYKGAGEIAYQTAFREGANWEKQHSIDRDKVIAEIENRIENFDFINSYSRDPISPKETLTDLLQVIKQM